MELRRIYPSDRQGIRQMQALLEQEGLSLDRHLDYSVGLYDEAGALVATGSFYRNTLRCLAVDSAWQGEGLLATVASHLISELAARGQTQLFLYTKPEAAESMRVLGFDAIVHTDQIVFMENRRDGFRRYLDGLSRPQPAPGRIAAIVMNANPFTLGHRHLVEQAASAADALHLFVVSEDISAFPYRVRERLIREGTADLSNVYLHPTGPYLVSSATFPAYFIQESEALTLAQARLDAKVFGQIAKELGITERFVGEEPYSPATALYNQAMQEELPAFQVKLTIIPRLQEGSHGAISATKVRALLKAGDLAAIQQLVPPTTYRVLISPDSQAIAAKLREKS